MSRSDPTRAAVLAAAYERDHQALYRYCRAILRHEQDAQDALQSTLARAFAALPDEPPDVDLRPWLFRIAHNESVSILRKRRPTVELDESVRSSGAMEDGVEAREALRALRRDIAELPERQRTALVLRELNGLGLDEIAEVLETTPAAARQTVFEARRSLSHYREGRALPCDDVQRVLSDGDGRVLRGRVVRAHLRACSDCRGFQADLTRRPSELAALAPPLPAAAAAAILAGLQTAAATSTGVSATATGLAAKVAVGVALVAGGTTTAQSVQEEPPPATHRETGSRPPPPREHVTIAAATSTAARRAATPSATAQPIRPEPTAARPKPEPRPAVAREERKRHRPRHRGTAGEGFAVDVLARKVAPAGRVDEKAIPTGDDEHEGRRDDTGDDREGHSGDGGDRRRQARDRSGERHAGPGRHDGREWRHEK